ncbi:type I-E CRISPR-associated protein Cas6/Cse3/CasE [Spongiactinospora rosea]|uniref:Type I-E CRISPR-associated protein Cas6/Cse3/CasE n=1 Tax=Spongiactinospora rosea TaxID=2248750 RepID=A0A366M6B0_9ACTN|nr:type I-E CRISPR-associated protein Cas6/Cse3/CasE [Spongiactinospora rosea]RBQ21069.1 type I-E CRISPR-associated protein Cas6/Cse3/CasE [Spongiactinospora rosea]
MFLTKLLINPRSAAFRRDVADVHDMHRTVMSGYPEMPPTGTFRSEHGVLWRIDTLPNGHIIQYVQSRTEPDWSGLPTDLLLKAAEVRSLQPVLDAVAPGRRFAFRLMANPTRCAHAKDSTDRKRVPLRQPAQQLEWLIGKGEQHGFVIPVSRQGGPDVAPSPAPRLIGKRRESRKITIDPVRFDGHLVVTDPELFTAALTTGIGRAKSYGCGLLSLAPARVKA